MRMRHPQEACNEECVTLPRGSQPGSFIHSVVLAWPTLVRLLEVSAHVESQWSMFVVGPDFL